jgi:hypothetical protein
MANAGAAGGDPNGSMAATAGDAKEKSGKGKDKYKPGGRKKK